MKRKTEKKNPRVDRLIKAAFPSLNGRQVEEALSAGLVRGEAGKKVKKGDRLPPRSSLRTEALEQHLEQLKRGNADLAVTVLTERPTLVVVDKPAGVPSHPLGLFETATATHWALARYPDLHAEFPQAQPQLAPHRLDTGTSGVLLLALTKASYDEWRTRFSEKKVTKEYLAWCWGNPGSDSFEVTLPIGPVPGDARRRRTLPELETGAFAAHSEIKVVERHAAQGFFLCSVFCRTGVTHQVRVHLASLGFPLAGDKLYDPNFETRSWKPESHQLRAVRLTSGEDVFYASPEEFKKAPFSAN